MKMFFSVKLLFSKDFSRTLPLAASVNTEQIVILVFISLFSGFGSIKKVFHFEIYPFAF